MLYKNPKKIPGFYFQKSRDRDWRSIPGSRDIPGSHWSLLARSDELFHWWQQEPRLGSHWTGCRCLAEEQQRWVGGEGGKKVRSGGWERSSVLTTSPSCWVEQCTDAEIWSWHKLKNHYIVYSPHS